jgi:hypothetical protein
MIMSIKTLNFIQIDNIKYKLRYNGFMLTALLVTCSSCKSRNLVEKSGQWDRIQYGEYLVDANTWNIQAAKSKWTETIFYDTLKGSMGWKWDFSGEKDELNTVDVKTFPEIIFGKKPYDSYESTTSRLPIKLASAQFKLEYEYSAKASGVYNTTTDLSFTDSENPEPSNIRAKMMIWFDHQNFPFFDEEKLIQAIIDKNQYKIFIDTTHIGLEGKWVFIALLPEKFPSQGELNFNEYFDYLLSEGVLKPEWYLSSIEVGSEISSGKGEIIFKQFIVH